MLVEVVQGKAVTRAAEMVRRGADTIVFASLYL